jgi:hypothetical protein
MYRQLYDGSNYDGKSIRVFTAQPNLSSVNGNMFEYWDNRVLSIKCHRFN